jgi:hypothetical protein
MSDQTDKQIAYLLGRLQRAEGELWAAQLAVRALILQQDDLAAAIAAVNRQIEGAIAAGLPKKIDEEFLDGLDRGKKRILPSKRDLDAIRRR